MISTFETRTRTICEVQLDVNEIIKVLWSDWCVANILASSTKTCL